MLYIRTPNEPCAFYVCNHHPSHSLCLVYISPLTITPYIFIDLVIYSSSVTHHTRLHTHTGTFLLSISETPSAFTAPNLLVYREPDTSQHEFVERVSFQTSMLSRCGAALRLRACLSKSLPSCAPASLRCPSIKRQPAILAQGDVFSFFLLPSPLHACRCGADPAPPGSEGIKSRSREDRGESLRGRGSGVEGHMSVCLAVCLLKTWFIFLP